MRAEGKEDFSRKSIMADRLGDRLGTVGREELEDSTNTTTTTTTWLSAHEYADEMKISVHTVWRLCRQGRLSHKRVGRSVRIPRSAMEMDPEAA